MKRDLYRQYQCARIDDTELADLAKLGISTRPPSGTLCYWPDENRQLWKEIGHVIVWDEAERRIEILPYEGVDDEDRAALAGAGWEAWFNGPEIDDQWEYRAATAGGTYWATTINTKVGADDPFAMIIRAAENFRERQDRLLDQGFDAA
jgi:hypothetical protein